MMNKTTFTLFMAFLLVNLLVAQDNFKNEDMEYDSQIGAVTFHYPGQYFSYPILSLGGNESLQLTFDDFSEDLRYYSYKVVLCNKDWTISDIPVLNYLDGYETNEIENNTFSFNTRAKYISHTLQIPNRNLKLKLSGNYMLYVWNDDTDEPVLSRRFMITENRVRVVPRVAAPDFVDKRRTHQEIKFSVSYDNYPISNPEREISATVMQNGRWLDAMTDVKPRFARNELINFEYLGDLTFPGGKEFRLVDTRSLNFTDPEIFGIEYFSDGYVVTMRPDKPRRGYPHSVYADLNGKFAIINSDDAQTAMRINPSQDTFSNAQEQLVSLQGLEKDRLINNALRSDYCTVEFFLDKSYELPDRDVYVIGNFNNWRLTQENKMRFIDGAYYCEIELKQGLADYMYVTTPIGSNKIDLGEIEGNSFESRNEYLIFIYQRSPIDQHDRIVGFKIFSSLN